MIRLMPFLIAAAIVTLASCDRNPQHVRYEKDPQHVRYEKDGHEITEQQWRDGFNKNPASVQECSRDTKDGKVSCGAG